MRTVPLGKSGVQVSIGCLGAMRFGTRTNEPTSFDILDAYIEAGGTFIDTANVYAVWEPGGKGGESELLLGRWLRARANRAGLFLASKVGSRLQEGGRSLRRETILRECEKSLKNLGVETIDLYYAHFDDPAAPQEESLAAFGELVRAGKVRFIGASNFRAHRLASALSVSRRIGAPAYCCAQQRFSYLQPVIGATFGAQEPTTADMLDVCREENVRVLAYSPLLGGSYGRPDCPIPPAYAGAIGDRRLAVLRDVAAQHGVSPNAIVLAWMVNREPAVIPIVAASGLEQIRQNLAALDMRLTADEMRRLNEQGL